MKITIAMDSFKGSMTSLQAGTAVKNGILKAKAAEVNVIPVADGGEGTLDALTYGKSVVKHTCTVTGPLGAPVQASYIVVGNDTAIIEMAEAAGLTLVPKHLRNPLHTTTYGVGELIRDAVEQGCVHFIVGIGGSATNDGGIGMLQALGFDMLRKDSKNVPFGATALQEIVSIAGHTNNFKSLHKLLSKCDFTVACDVDNPLVGEMGCSRVFAPQKGATPHMVEDMDEWMNHYADVVEAFFKDKAKCNNRFTPGTGAAGGLGYAFLMFLGAKLMSGADIVIRETKLGEHIMSSDMVIVGEGKMDAQSIRGKIPFTIAKLAKKYNKKVVAYAGVIEDREVLEAANVFDGIYPIDRGDMTIEEAMKPPNAINNLKITVEKTLKC